jgi:hypothetical protein
MYTIIGSTQRLHARDAVTRLLQEWHSVFILIELYVPVKQTI